MEFTRKIVSAPKLEMELAKLRRSGKKIVFTNGCFDLLHVGHVRYLTAARSQGNLLVVGLNSDASVRSIKGDKRPIVVQDQRAELLANFACVDHVVVFDEPDPLALIRRLKPDILVKGEDWTEDNIIGAEFVKARGGKVVRIAFAVNSSTSRIIEQIVARYC